MVFVYCLTVTDSMRLQVVIFYAICKVILSSQPLLALCVGMSFF